VRLDYEPIGFRFVRARGGTIWANTAVRADGTEADWPQNSAQGFLEAPLSKVITSRMLRRLLTSYRFGYRKMVYKHDYREW
jgi:hypothetical protein